jgi:hypothetical protein
MVTVTFLFPTVATLRQRAQKDGVDDGGDERRMLRSIVAAPWTWALVLVPWGMAANALPGYIRSIMTIRRRDFLTRAALAGGLLALPAGLFAYRRMQALRGPRRTDHYFVFYFLVGGWDLMFVTDPVPRKDGFFVPYDDDEVVDVGGVRLGPAMKPLAPWASRMGILKGIHCDALNHPQARYRMVTGRFKPPGDVLAPSIQTLVAQKLGQRYELPNLSADQLRPASFRGIVADRRLEPVRVASVEQLAQLTSLSGAISDDRALIEDALRKKDALTARRLATSSSSLPSDFVSFAELERDLAQSDYGRRADAGSTMIASLQQAFGGNRVGAQVRLAVEAVAQDLAPVITVGTGEFDSHTKNEYASHPAAVRRGLKAVADIVSGLDSHRLDDGRSLLDVTTVVVTSEFSRTPSKNELGGKHHWPTNAMLFIGKGVRPGPGGAPRIFGAVDDNLVAQAINPENGSLKRGTELLDMSHGLATVLAMAGLDPSPLLSQDPIADLLV